MASILPFKKRHQDSPEFLGNTAEVPVTNWVNVVEGKVGPEDMQAGRERLAINSQLIRHMGATMEAIEIEAYKSVVAAEEASIADETTMGNLHNQRGTAASAVVLAAHREAA